MNAQKVSQPGLLTSAILNEKVAADAFDHYADIMIRSHQIRIGETFRTMARREREIVQRLITARSHLFPNAPWKPPQEIEPPVGPLNERSLTLDDAVGLIAESECDRERFYKNASIAATNPGLYALFRGRIDELIQERKSP